MQVVPPICVFCEHFDQDENAEKLTCNAFPLGIPVAILHSNHDHRKPYDGDNGVLFKKSSNVSAQELQNLIALLGFDTWQA